MHDVVLTIVGFDPTRAGGSGRRSGRPVPAETGLRAALGISPASSPASSVCKRQLRPFRASSPRSRH